MYYELYIDVLFLENLVLDYLLLRLVRQILGCSATQLRMCLAAGLGSLSFCVLCWFSLLWTVPGMLISYVGISMLMVKLGYGIRGRGEMLRALGLLYVCSLLLGGILTWMQEAFWPAKLPLWLLAVPGLLVLELSMSWIFSVRRQRASLCQVTLFYGGVCRTLTGLWDTGNQLYDPLHQKPVSIVERSALEPEVSKEELLFPVSYHSVGKKDGMLQALIADYLTVQLGKRTCLIRRPVLALAEEALSSDGSYTLILNPNAVDN
ncbi:MAG: sigma-E processing peptidase SpoIIGA [Lachnospiraceae bacterium]|nr:sigma-E processing peptidase SpoIIGA [Lachnospiraceae bacterium]